MFSNTHASKAHVACLGLMQHSAFVNLFDTVPSILPRCGNMHLRLVMRVLQLLCFLCFTWNTANSICTSAHGIRRLAFPFAVLRMRLMSLIRHPCKARPSIIRQSIPMATATSIAFIPLVMRAAPLLNKPLRPQPSAYLPSLHMPLAKLAPAALQWYH